MQIQFPRTNKLFRDKCECARLIELLSREPRPANADKLIADLRQQIEAIDQEIKAGRR